MKKDLSIFTLAIASAIGLVIIVSHHTEKAADEMRAKQAKEAEQYRAAKVDTELVRNTASGVDSNGDIGWITISNPPPSTWSDVYTFGADWPMRSNMLQLWLISSPTNTFPVGLYSTNPIVQFDREPEVVQMVGSNRWEVHFKK